MGRRRWVRSEVFWDTCCNRAIGEPYEQAAERALRTFSGGERNRMALEAILRSEFDVLLLDEPDNFLDVPGTRWLEEDLRGTRKTLLYVSHDRELLAATATKVVTIEARGCRLRQVTHDRRFLRGFDRFLVFEPDCSVSDHLDRPAAWR